MLSLEYIAGFFDGEGCVCITRATRKNGKTYLQLWVTIAQKNPEILYKICEQVGGHVSGEKKSRARQWVITGGQGAEFLRTIQPYCVVKREAILLGLEFYATVDRNAGFAGISDEVRAQREDIRGRLQLVNAA